MVWFKKKICLDLDTGLTGYRVLSDVQILQGPDQESEGCVYGEPSVGHLSSGSNSLAHGNTSAASLSVHRQLTKTASPPTGLVRFL